MLRLIGALDHLPAAVLGHRSEVLARNALFESVLTRRCDRRVVDHSSLTELIDHPVAGPLRFGRRVRQPAPGPR